MENSILTSTKKILGLGETYTPFDLDVITYINSALSVLNQLGIGPDAGLAILDTTASWTDLALPTNQESMVKVYVFMKVRMLFDPPATSFLIEAMNEQITEHEHRLSLLREGALIPVITPVIEGVV